MKANEKFINALRDSQLREWNEAPWLILEAIVLGGIGVLVGIVIRAYVWGV